MRLVVLVAVLLVHGGQTDDLRMGRCHSDFLVSNIPGFNGDKILGRWYVKKETHGAKDCTSVYFGRNKKGEMRFSEVSWEVGDDIELSNPATLKFDVKPDGSFIINMKFDQKSSWDGTLRILATDIDNYLLLYTCKNMLFTHRESYLFLFRNWEEDHSFDEELESALILASADQKKKIEPTKHVNCKQPIEDELFYVPNEFRFVRVEQPKPPKEERKKDTEERDEQKDREPLIPDEGINQFFRDIGPMGNETEFYDF